MKQFVKRLLYTIAPGWTTALLSARARAHSHCVVASWGCGTLNHKLFERFGNTVQDGPFAGLTLTAMTRAEQIGPYLLGVYESELDEAWAIIFRGSYSQIINVGAKFGYYGIGLAKRYPTAAVVAFDADWWARNAIREMVAANRAGNVEVHGFCGPEWLARHAKEAAFVFSDCEGYEAVLFGPDVTPKLRTATLLIETHDYFLPGICDRLRAAFGETHVVRVYDGDAGRRGPAHALDFLSESERRLTTREVRSPPRWLLCLPKSGPNRLIASQVNIIPSTGTDFSTSSAVLADALD